MPSIPPEIVEKILEESLTDLDFRSMDSPYLSKTALVSRRWRHHANAIRFSVLEMFLTDRTSRYTYKRINAFAELLTSNIWPVDESISQHIQQCIVLFPVSKGELRFAMFIVKESFTAILNALFRMPFHSISRTYYYPRGNRQVGYGLFLGSTISIVPSHGRIIADISILGKEISIALERVCTGPYMSFLTLEHLEQVPRTLCRMSAVTHLRSVKMSFAPLAIVDSADKRMSFSDLKYIVFDTEPAMLDALLLLNPPPPLLRYLNIQFNRSADLDMGLQVLHHLGRTLTSLVIQFDYNVHNLPGVLLNYAHLGSLTSLKIKFNQKIEELRPTTGNQPSIMACALRLLPPEPSPELCITIDIKVGIAEWDATPTSPDNSIPSSLDVLYNYVNDTALVDYLRPSRMLLAHNSAATPRATIILYLEFVAPTCIGEFILSEDDQSKYGEYLRERFGRLYEIQGVSLVIEVLFKFWK